MSYDIVDRVAERIIHERREEGVPLISFWLLSKGEKRHPRAMARDLLAGLVAALVWRTL